MRCFVFLFTKSGKPIFNVKQSKERLGCWSPLRTEESLIVSSLLNQETGFDGIRQEDKFRSHIVLI